MGQQIPNGGQLQIASAIAAPLTVTVASNASSAVLTVTNTYSIGDYVEFISGWSRATNRVYRLSAASGTSITLEGLDTSSTANFPVGGGLGTVRKITTWTQILQVINFQFTGGEIQKNTFQYLENLSETEYQTVTSAMGVDFSLADDIALPGYQALVAASNLRAQTPMRLVLPSNNIITMSTVPFVNQSVQVSINELITVNATASILNTPVRY